MWWCVYFLNLSFWCALRRATWLFVVCLRVCACICTSVCFCMCVLLCVCVRVIVHAGNVWGYLRESILHLLESLHSQCLPPPSKERVSLHKEKRVFLPKNKLKDDVLPGSLFCIHRACYMRMGHTHTHIDARKTTYKYAWMHSHKSLPPKNK